MVENLSLNPLMNIELIHIGTERLPVIVIDHMVSQPTMLIEDAVDGGKFQTVSSDYFPGVRRPLGNTYSALLCELIDDQFKSVFSLNDGALSHVSLCAYSLTTTAPEKLRPIQSLPHFDNSADSQLAVVHYLCGPEYGGTAFYRHCKTGFESISENRIQQYARELKHEVIGSQFLGGSYMEGDRQGFECTQIIEAKFNRAILFKGNLLHSGNIKPELGLSSDPQTGRLTATTFINYETH